MEHLLLKAFRRLKHTCDKTSSDYRRSKLSVYSKALVENTPTTERERDLRHGDNDTTPSRRKLAAIAKRGVPLVTALRYTSLFSEAALATSHMSYTFTDTLKFWYTAATGNPAMSTGGLNNDEMAAIGYTIYRGKPRPIAGLVRDRSGNLIEALYANTTLWGICEICHTVDTKVISKQLKALLPVGTVLTEQTYLVPSELMSPAYRCSVEQLVWKDGRWTRPDMKAPFEIAGLGGYHSSRGHIRPLDALCTDDIRIGLEIELQLQLVDGKRRTPTAVAVAKFFNKVIHPRYTLVEEDGSVYDGFELVTSPATIQFHKAAMLTLAKAVAGKGERTNPLLRCEPVSYQAGVHIHVDKRSVKNWLALSALFNTAGYDTDALKGARFRETMFGRFANRFCLPYGLRADRSKYEHQGGKYRPINDEHEATYEARVFSSSNDPMVLLGHIEVMHAAVAMTNSIVGVPQYKLTSYAFAKYCLANKATYPHAAARAEKYLALPKETE